MPQIFDNIDLALLPALWHTLEVANRVDFCVGYFNLRGWKQIARQVDRWEGGEACGGAQEGVRPEIDGLAATLFQLGRLIRMDDSSSSEQRTGAENSWRDEKTASVTALAFSRSTSGNSCAESAASGPYSFLGS